MSVGLLVAISFLNSCLDVNEFIGYNNAFNLFELFLYINMINLINLIMNNYRRLNGELLQWDFKGIKLEHEGINWRIFTGK